MKPKILLIGKNGQIGFNLRPMLADLGELTALDSGQLNLFRPGDIRAAIRAIRPAILVNAAAYTAVDQAESDSKQTEAINTEAPAVMAEEAKKIGALLVHYSTDYVFDGSKRTPYIEDDPTNPLSVYGKTKLAGEESIRQSGASHLIFRTAWVYATRGRNFLLTMLRLATSREELRIVNDQIGAPTWSREIAKATADILSQVYTHAAASDWLSEVTGTYHMTAAGETTWFEFAEAILEEAGKIPPSPWLAEVMGGREIMVQKVSPISTDEYPTPARRPAYSVLSSSKLLQTFGRELPPWRVQLRSVFAPLSSE